MLRLNQSLSASAWSHTVARLATLINAHPRRCIRLLIAVMMILFLSACGSAESEEAFLEAVELNELDIVSLSITIDSGNDTLQDGTSDRARAIAQRSGGQADLDVSDRVNWSSSDNSVLTVDRVGNLAAQTGIDSQATIFAELADLSATNVLSVSTADLITITVTSPGSVSVCSGDHQLTASGNYGPGDDRNLTSLVTWASSTSSDLATISEAGVVDTFGSGSADFTASFDGIVSATESLTIDDDLDTIAITPGTPSIEAGTSLQFTATGTYDDASTLNITTASAWTSDTTSALTITPSGGLATGVAEGTANIQASCNNSNPVNSDSLAVTVTAAVTAERVFISRNGDEGPLRFNVDDSPVQLRAFLEFSDTTTEDITTRDNGDNDEITWIADAPISGVGATVANDGNNKGDLSFTGEGETIIRIIYDRNGRTFEDVDGIRIIVED